MPTGSSNPALKTRDVRLDFFRGIGMFIIYFAHIPNNPWNGWIPARFGYSDATEIFVFCSGVASAIAFAKIFDERGFARGCARISHRCWQVYWAHIGLFLVGVACVAQADRWFGTGTLFQNSINVVRFLNEGTAEGIIGLLTLTYVPNLFDILPMYLVLLTMIPIVMALSRLGAWAPIAFCVGLWLVGTAGYWQFPAEPWGDRHWFFHPLAWQLVFFTGFAFIRGWLPAPPINRYLVAAAMGVLIAAACMVVPSMAWLLPLPAEWTQLPNFLINKTTFGGLRYLHFLALAYMALVLAGPAGSRLSGRFVEICARVGQQSLAVFMAGIILSIFGGIVFELQGRGAGIVTLVNIVGCILLIAVAETVHWYKSAPWKPQRSQASQSRAETHVTPIPVAAE